MKHALSRVCGALSVALLVLAPIAADAQAIQYRDSDNINNINVSVAQPLPVTGSISASLSGFTPNGNVATRAVTTSSANVALPAGNVVAVSNTGSVAASIKLSVGAGSAATTDFQLQPGATIGLTVGSNTFINAITASGSTSLSIAGGDGLVSGFGGSGLSGGGAITAASGAFASGSIASGAVASGAIASGAVASGAIASGAVASGAVVDGAIVTLGSKTDAKSTATDSTSVSAMQVLKQISASAQAGTNTTGSTVPASAIYVGANSAGNLTGIIQADSSAAINISTATTTQLVALSSGKKIYVTNYKVIAGGTGNFKFVYGTGSNCGTGTTDLEGNNNLTAQSGSSAGGGLGTILVVPASNALCATTSAAVQMSGHVAYTQF